MRGPKLLGASLLMAAAGLVPALALAGPASAASDYSHAQYQVTFALNCNNPSAPCQQVFGLGGIWGWIALQPGGTVNGGTGSGNAQVTDCGHSVRGGGPGTAGAQHVSFDPTWTVVSSSTPPSPITPVDPNGQYLELTDPTSISLGIPPLPATYGHYSVSFLGAKGEVTIAP